MEKPIKGTLLQSERDRQKYYTQTFNKRTCRIAKELENDPCVKLRSLVYPTTPKTRMEKKNLNETTEKKSMLDLGKIVD